MDFVAAGLLSLLIFLLTNIVWVIVYLVLCGLMAWIGSEKGRSGAGYFPAVAVGEPGRGWVRAAVRAAAGEEVPVWIRGLPVL